jgi:hypothetical protein
MDINLKFKDWLLAPESEKPVFADSEIANMYFHNPQVKVREIANKTGRSVAEVYRILHQFGSPNRQINNHENVMMFANSGFSVNKIAEFTGYTPRNIRYILKKTER